MAYTTYSFKDLSGVFTHPLAGTLRIGTIDESSGIGQITVHMSNDNTIHDIGVDGSVIIWPVAVFNGVVTIQCQQTSSVHKYFSHWFNLLKTAIINTSNPDVSNWANGAMLLRNINNGNTHDIRGISPQIQPDKTYAAQGGTVTWSLMAGNIDNDRK
jgi:hypothetical protein